MDFFVPNDAFDSTGQLKLGPHGSINLPSGIVVELPAGYGLVGFNKSSLAKEGLQVGACIIDSDYHGEVHLHVFNASDHDVVIKRGQKLVQFLVVPILHVSIEEVEYIDRDDSQRGAGGFGSTGKF